MSVEEDVPAEPVLVEADEPAVDQPEEPAVGQADEEPEPELAPEAEPVAPATPEVHAQESPVSGGNGGSPAVPDAPSVDAPGADDAKKWFIVHTYSGFEQKVAESLRSRSQAFGFADKIGQILIPTEEVVELRGGKKVTSKRLVYPGYVLVQMEMNDELWHAVKATPRVTGFVGGGSTPVPLSPDEVNQILYRQASSAERIST